VLDAYTQPACTGCRKVTVYAECEYATSMCECECREALSACTGCNEKCLFQRAVPILNSIIPSYYFYPI